MMKFGGVLCSDSEEVYNEYDSIEYSEEMEGWRWRMRRGYRRSGLQHGNT